MAIYDRLYILIDMNERNGATLIYRFSFMFNVSARWKIAMLCRKKRLLNCYKKPTSQILQLRQIFDHPKLKVMLVKLVALKVDRKYLLTFLKISINFYLKRWSCWENQCV